MNEHNECHYEITYDTFQFECEMRNKYKDVPLEFLYESILNQIIFTLYDSDEVGDRAANVLTKAIDDAKKDFQQ